MADAIVTACDDVLAGRHDDAFITDALSKAGTSTNMNVNEVLANLAILKLGGTPGDYTRVSPLDHVNRSQSTNDVYPSALRIAAICLVRELADALAKFQESLQKKEQAFADIQKLGRTQAMDAAPVTLGETLALTPKLSPATAGASTRSRSGCGRSTSAAPPWHRCCRRPGGATPSALPKSCDLTGLGLARAEYPMDLTQNNDVFVEVSGLLKACAVNLLKISNDLRLLNLTARRLRRTPLGGAPGRIVHHAGEGQSGHPRVRRVQCAMQTIANDTAITLKRRQRMKLSLNAFMPLIADALLDSAHALRNAVTRFRAACIDTLEADPDACARHLHASTAPALFLVPTLGYEAAAALAKESLATGKTIRQLVAERQLLPPEGRALIPASLGSAVVRVSERDCSSRHLFPSTSSSKKKPTA